MTPDSKVFRADAPLPARRRKRKYVVIENTPGYMPDDTDPAVFSSLREARAYAKSLADELRDQDYKVTGDSRRGYYGERSKNDLGRVIEIIEDDG